MERTLGRGTRGSAGTRCYRFPAREIARTLVALGQGQTYRQAAARARGWLAGGGDSRHGQLAADWVEVFAPVVFARHAPTSWPDDGTLVLDHLYVLDHRGRFGRVLRAAGVG